MNSRRRYLAHLKRLLQVGIVTLPASAAGQGAGYGSSSPPGMVHVEGGSFGDAKVGGFHLDRTEVTVGDYRRCVEAGVCEPSRPDNWLRGLEWAYNWDKPGREGHPMNGVSHTAATAFCAWAGKRLPSEQEWEWAARSRGHAHRFAWGNDAPTGREVNACGLECAATLSQVVLPDAKGDKQRLYAKATPLYPRSDGFKATAPVGSIPRDTTVDGVLDLGGNVHEWTRTAHGGNPAMRGGAWEIFNVAQLPVTWRVPLSPITVLPTLGFRCARAAGGAASGAASASPAAPVELPAGGRLLRIQFAAGSAIPASQRPALDALAASLGATPKVTRVRIEGHTDNQLDDRRSLALSGRRAQAVKVYLVRRGISEDRLVALGFGNNQPIASNADASGMAANSRVDLHVAEIDGTPAPRENPLEGGTVFP